ncbi:MAG: ATP-binding protein [Allobranchiibius sp.]
MNPPDRPSDADDTPIMNGLRRLPSPGRREPPGQSVSVIPPAGRAAIRRYGTPTWARTSRARSRPPNQPMFHPWDGSHRSATSICAESKSCREGWAAYEKRSVEISSNLHPAGFDELMPKTLATPTATVERLLHHAHICRTTGESIRLSQALT